MRRSVAPWGASGTARVRVLARTRALHRSRVPLYGAPVGFAPDSEYDCTWTRRGVSAVVTSRGPMRGPEAFDRYLSVVNTALSDPEVRAIVSDVRGATQLPTVGDCIRFAQMASANPHGLRVRRSAVVTRDGHPLMSLLLRIIAAGSRFFPERRVFPNDLEAALAWTNDVAPEQHTTP